MKKLLAMVLALVMTLSLAVSANAAFEDAKDINATYAEAVDVLAGMKVFQGYDNGKTFKPQGDITRAEVAAIVYRIYTADVKDSYVKNYETYNKFSDMAGAGWAKGYIGYCANAALVKGYPNGTFLPSGKVTGYEVLAMILRAVGYDKNNEFTGADWALHVAQIAEQNKILKNVKGIDLSAPASRELVAELLFQAIQVPTVTYTAAFGYQDVSLTADKKTDKYVKANSSLGYKSFKLVFGDGTDNWGRPTTIWAKDANDNGEYDAKKDTTKYATIVATPDAAFHVATSQCDICEALGEKKEAKIVEAYVNGVNDSAAAKALLETYKATATKAMVGAQGEQIEFYQNKDGDYRLVVIDTYLAYVNEVVTEKTDSKNHITRDAYMQLDVYNKGYQGGASELYVKGNDYAEGDYVLVNVNENAKITKSIILTNNKSAVECKLVEIVAKAESFEGAQTSIWSKTSKHTIDKTDYLDAVQFNLDAAGATGTVKYTWFLDQFGNLIGSAVIDNDNYAILKDILWIPGADDHAQATLVYMDGKEESVEVAKIDGLQTKEDNSQKVSDLNSDDEFYGDFSTALKGSETRQGDTYTDVKFVSSSTAKYAYVSTSGSSNTAYKGMALYLVETNKDGSVNLTGADVDYVDGTTVNSNSNVMVGEGSTKYALSDSTKFIVRELNEKDEYVYKTYSLKDLPPYKDNSAEVYYVLGANKYVSYVYIKNATDAASMSDYIFVANASNSSIEYNVEDNYYAVKVFVDGKEQMVKASAEIAATLAENEGKLFAAKWYENSNDSHFYGELQYVKLVNEATDSTNFGGKAATTVDYVTGKKFDVSKMFSYKDYNVKTADLDYVWELDGATIIDADGKKVEIADLDAKDGIWVVSEETKYEGKALFVYVGEALSNETGLTASYKVDAEGAKDTALTFEKNSTTGAYEAKVELAKGETAASYTYEAADKNVKVGDESLNSNWGWLASQYEDVKTVVVGKASRSVKYYVGNYKNTAEDTDGSIVATVKVTAEDGVTVDTYSINVTKGAVKHACKDVTWDNSKITYTLAWDGDAVKVTVANNSTLTVKDLKDALYIHEAGSEKACATAQGIVIYDTVIGNTAHVAEDTLKLTVGMTDLVAIATAEDGTTYQFSITVVAQ